MLLQHDALWHVCQFLKLTPQQISILERTCKHFAALVNGTTTSKTVALWSRCHKFVYYGHDAKNKDDMRAKFLLAKMNQMQIFFMGADCSGKSTTIWQFRHDAFLQEYEPSCWEPYMYTVHFELDSKKHFCVVELVDMQEQDMYMRTSFVQEMRKAMGIIWVASSTNKESLHFLRDNLQRMYEEEPKYFPQMSAMLNKSDLPMDRQVLMDDFRQVVPLFVPVYETSAKLRVGIDAALSELVARIYQKLIQKYTPIIRKPKPKKCNLQ